MTPAGDELGDRHQVRGAERWQVGQSVEPAGELLEGAVVPHRVQRPRVHAEADCLHGAQDAAMAPEDLDCMPLGLGGVLLDRLHINYLYL